MKLRRVVVTGLGAVSPIGNDVPTMWENAIAGVSGAGPITHFDASLFKTHFACEVKGFDATTFMEKKELRKVDTHTHYGIAAAVGGLCSVIGIQRSRTRLADALHALERERGGFDRPARKRRR